MSTTPNTNSQPAAEAGTNKKATDYNTLKRELYCEIPSLTGVMLARFTAENTILAIMGVAGHFRKSDHDVLLYVDPRELGRSDRAKSAAGSDPEKLASAGLNLLAAVFKMNPTGEDAKKFANLSRGGLTPVCLSDDNAGGEQRITRIAEMSSPGGFWAMGTLKKEPTLGRVAIVWEKLVSSSWGIPKNQVLVPATSNTGPEALPMHEDAAGFALQYATAWSAARALLDNIGFKAVLLSDDGRSLAGIEHLQYQRTVRNRGGFQLAGIPAATLAALTAAAAKQPAKK